MCTESKNRGIDGIIFEENVDYVNENDFRVRLKFALCNLFSILNGAAQSSVEVVRAL